MRGKLLKKAQCRQMMTHITKLMDACMRKNIIGQYLTLTAVRVSLGIALENASVSMIPGLK